MTHADLHNELLDTIRNYWRIRNITEIIRATQILHPNILIEYQNTNHVSGVPVFPSNEILETSINSLHTHATQRMACDYFLILISKYEHFLSSHLKFAGQSGQGTLGNLQKAAEQTFQLSGPSVALGLEIRERRNCIIHNEGKADLRYINAAANAALISNGHVSPASIGDIILPRPEYLNHVADSLLLYSQPIP